MRPTTFMLGAALAFPSHAAASGCTAFCDLVADEAYQDCVYDTKNDATTCLSTGEQAYNGCKAEQCSLSVSVPAAAELAKAVDSWAIAEWGSDFERVAFEPYLFEDGVGSYLGVYTYKGQVSLDDLHTGVVGGDLSDVVRAVEVSARVDRPPVIGLFVGPPREVDEFSHRLAELEKLTGKTGWILAERKGMAISPVLVFERQGVRAISLPQQQAVAEDIEIAPPTLRITGSEADLYLHQRLVQWKEFLNQFNN